MYVGYIIELSLPNYLGTNLFFFQLLWQIWSADLNSSTNLWKRFDSNKYAGSLIFLSILSGKMF